MHEVTPVAHPVSRAAQLTGLSRSQLYLLMKRRELAFVKVGRRRLITHDDLQSLINRHRVDRDFEASNAGYRAIAGARPPPAGSWAPFQRRPRHRLIGRLRWPRA